MNLSVTYRPMESREAKIVSALVERVFLAYNASDYTVEGVQNISAHIQPIRLRERLQHHHFVIVALVDEQIVGMIEVRHCNHLSLFFVDAAFHGHGIGRSLFEKALEYCVPVPSQISVNASLFAVPIYEKLGFAKVGDEQIENGVRFVPMEWNLEAD